MKHTDPSKTTVEATEFPGQHPGEEVVMVFRHHPVVMRHPLIYGMLLILAGVVPLMIWPLSNIAVMISLGSLLLAILYWFYTWIGWYYSVFILTDRRLIDIEQKGLFNRKVSEVGLDRIQSLNYHIKGIQAALFRFGTITVQTYVGEWVMEQVEHPVEVHSALMAATREIDSTGSTPNGD